MIKSLGVGGKDIGRSGMGKGEEKWLEKGWKCETIIPQNSQEPAL